MRFESSNLEVCRVEFTKSRQCLKILQISDVHVNRLYISSYRVAKIIKKEKPDLVLFTGDYVEKPRHMEKIFLFLDTIKDSSDMFLCLGNHDYRAFRNDEKGLQKFIKGVESRNVVVLHNQSACYEKYGRKYNIIGIDDLGSGYCDVKKALNSCYSNAHTNIAFSHNPDVALKLPAGSVDFLFCGHFHGGQIWAPFNLEFILLRKDRLCKEGKKRGLHVVNGIRLYINRGLGNVLLPLRFLSRPEITVYHI